MNQLSADFFCNLRERLLAWRLFHQHDLWLNLIRLHLGLLRRRAIAGRHQLLFSFTELVYCGLVVLAQPCVTVDEFLVFHLQVVHLP